MGPEPDSVRRIPGLKIETWGTRPISSEVCLGRRGFDSIGLSLFLGGVIFGYGWGLG
jgi:hypothetical protein